MLILLPLLFFVPSCVLLIYGFVKKSKIHKRYGLLLLGLAIVFAIPILMLTVPLLFGVH